MVDMSMYIFCVYCLQYLPEHVAFILQIPPEARNRENTCCIKPTHPLGNFIGNKVALCCSIVITDNLYKALTLIQVV